MQTRLEQTPLNILLGHICQSGGAEYQGLQMPFEHLPALVLLTPHDAPSDQKTTGALPLAELSTERVRDKVAELRARFAPRAPRLWTCPVCGESPRIGDMHYCP
jgi:hypothetical protein